MDMVVRLQCPKPSHHVSGVTDRRRTLKSWLEPLVQITYFPRRPGSPVHRESSLHPLSYHTGWGRDEWKSKETVFTRIAKQKLNMALHRCSSRREPEGGTQEGKTWGRVTGPRDNNLGKTGTPGNLRNWTVLERMDSCWQLELTANRRGCSPLPRLFAWKGGRKTSKNHFW